MVDALEKADANASVAAGTAKQGIPVSAVKAIDISQLKVISVKDNPELRDRMAEVRLRMQAARSAAATEVPDNAPQNTYATVKVNGKIVATLYDGGSVAMTNQAAAMVGDLAGPSRSERRSRSGAMARGAHRKGRGWRGREGIHCDHAVRMEATSDYLDKLYARAIGCGLRSHDGRTTEGHRAELCGLFNSARIVRRLHRLQRLMLFNAPLMAA